MDKDQTIVTYSEATRQNNLYIINYVFNSISILCSTLILTTIITLQVKKLSYSNRISLRLIKYVSMAEILYSISHILRINSYRFPKWISYIASLGYIFSSLLICFLIITILFNVKLIYIYNYKNTTHFERYYLIIPLSLAMLLSFMPFLFYELKFDQVQNRVWYSSITWEWATYLAWIIWSIMYCTFSISLILYSINKRSKGADSTSIDNSESSSSATHFSKNTSRHVTRITFYSLIPILTYLPTIILDLYYIYIGNNNSLINIISLLFSSSQGIFTLIIFLFDPVISQLRSCHEKDKQHKQVVLDTVRKGVYVENIYKLDLPRKRDQQEQQINDANDIHAKNAKKSSIYNLVFALYDNRRSLIVRNDHLNLDNDNDMIALL